MAFLRAAAMIARSLPTRILAVRYAVAIRRSADVARSSTAAARLIVVGLLLGGCAVPVANGLDEFEATRVAAELDHAGIEATKEPDPAAEGKYRVQVGHDDTASALALMRQEELAKPRPKGVLDAVGQGSLVPSPLAEHVQYASGLAGDLERTLLGVDGIVAARVHLNLAIDTPFRDAKTPLRSSASVLVEHRGSSSPLPIEAIARLIAGGAPGLAKEDVGVVLVMRPLRPQASGERFAKVGPFSVARASRTGLQVALGSLLIGFIALVGGAAWLFAKLTRTRSDLADAEGALAALPIATTSGPAGRASLSPGTQRP
jgi:type III secretion protein J